MSSIRSAVMGLALLTASAFCGVPLAAEPVAPAAVDEARMAAASQDAADWLGVGRTYDEQRFSPLSQINSSNVKTLGLAWYADLGSTRGLEATPIEVDGVLYDIQPWNITTAFDAKTGKLLWRYDPKVPEKTGRIACCDIVTKGVAAWKGKIYVATLDGRLIALDAKTGQPVWSVNTFDDGSPWPYTMTGAPRVFDGKVVVGNAGGEVAARGFITAYDAETGKKDWRFYITPGDPSQPRAPNQVKADKISAPTWGKDWFKQGGGGNAWDGMVYDPKARLVYIATGNGGPWASQYRGGPGDSLFTSSILAVHVDTGDYAWHYQEVPGDQWDFDATAPLMLADLKIDGQVRPVIMHAPKDGFFYVLDRLTGKVISAKAYVPQNWNLGFDKNWRPTINPKIMYGLDPVLVTPSASHNWQPMAFNPRTGLVYFPVSEGGRIVRLDPNFKLEPGRMTQLGEDEVGGGDSRKVLQAQARTLSKTYLIAYDPVAQKEVWRAPYAGYGTGGVLATAGNLVFEGYNDAAFAAYDAKTGAKVWDMPVQQVPIAAPLSYMVDGEQYIAVNAGFGGGLAHDGANASNPNLQLYDYGRLLVFKLGGKAQLPEFHYVKATLAPPPPIHVSNHDAQIGGELYAKNCQACHGEQARGGIKDLRRMSPATHAEFLDIVIGGKRSANGMASFADTLSKDQAELIHQFIIARINDDWTDLKNGH